MRVEDVVVNFVENRELTMSKRHGGWRRQVLLTWGDWCDVLRNGISAAATKL
jgi:hypothetical protein